MDPDGACVVIWSSLIVDALAGGVATTGVKVQLAAPGSPEQERFTASEKPFCEVTVKSTVLKSPGLSDNVEGFAVTVKPGTSLVASATTEALAEDAANAVFPW